MPLVPAEVKSTKTRNGKKMIGRMKDVLKQCGVASCVIWCGVWCGMFCGAAPPRLRACVRARVCVCDVCNCGSWCGVLCGLLYGVVWCCVAPCLLCMLACLWCVNIYVCSRR